MTEKFDFNEALKAIQSDQAISGKDGVLAQLLKQLTEAALNAINSPRRINIIISTRRRFIIDPPINTTIFL